MSDVAVVICGEHASSCVCALTPGHDGPHACGNDQGKWLGTHGTDSFEVVQFPIPLVEFLGLEVGEFTTYSETPARPFSYHEAMDAHAEAIAPRPPVYPERRTPRQP